MLWLFRLELFLAHHYFCVRVAISYHDISHESLYSFFKLVQLRGPKLWEPCVRIWAFPFPKQVCCGSWVVGTIFPLSIFCMLHIAQLLYTCSRPDSKNAHLVHCLKAIVVEIFNWAAYWSRLHLYLGCIWEGTWKKGLPLPYQCLIDSISYNCILLSFHSFRVTLLLIFLCYRRCFFYSFTLAFLEFSAPESFKIHLYHQLPFFYALKVSHYQHDRTYCKNILFFTIIYAKQAYYFLV